MIESVDDAPEHWRTEKISFQAAYGNERVTAYLFLPRNAVPPYQTVVHYPGGYAFRSRSSENLSTQFVEFLLRSGHAVLYPIYKGSYERGGGLPPAGPSAWRDQTVQQSRDLGRSIDYLETRPDIDRDRLAFYGLSAGAINGPILTALEPRFKASILVSGGFPTQSLPPEADPINFAPRAKMPGPDAEWPSRFLTPPGRLSRADVSSAGRAAEGQAPCRVRKLRALSEPGPDARADQRGAGLAGPIPGPGPHEVKSPNRPHR